MLTLLSFLVVIGVLVFVHELGHLLAAKSVDIEVPRFSIGFGPRVTGFHWGETEYVISALPLGGYVQMAGMEDASALEGEQPEEREPSGRDFDAKPLWARIWVVSAGVLMNFLFAILVFAATLFYFGEQIVPSTRLSVRAEAELAGEAAVLRALPEGGEIVAVGGTPVETWNDVVEVLAVSRAGPLTLEFADRPAVTLQLPEQYEARQRLLTYLQPLSPAVIGDVVEESPAASGGIQPGDRIVAAAGEPVESWRDLVAVVQARPGEELPLTIQRDGEPISLRVTPEPETLDEIGTVGRLGVYPQSLETHTRRVGPVTALQEGWNTTWNIAGEIVSLVGALFTGGASPRSLGGPVAIGQLSAEAARIGAEAFLRWMGLLSVNLAVLNLLPIPVLDGGQLLLLGVEGVRGRPLSLEQRLRMSQLGLILVVGIMVWVLTNDVLRLFGI